MKTLTIEVVPTNNYPSGYSTQSFELLGPVWAGSSVTVPLREEKGGEKEMCEVTGWDAVQHLGPTSIHVARVRTNTGKEGYVVYGDAAGVRVLDKRAKVKAEGDEYLPRGHGRPFVWIAREDIADLPDEVRNVVEQDVEDSDDA
ncbi:MAG: hypothetical protein AB7G75_10225 [Candidatus Binatia bacterium]